MEGVTQFSTSEGVEAGESVCDCEREKGGEMLEGTAVTQLLYSLPSLLNYSVDAL